MDDGTTSSPDHCIQCHQQPGNLLQSVGTLCHAKESIVVPNASGQLYPMCDGMRMAYFEISKNRKRLLAIEPEIRILVISMHPH